MHKLSKEATEQFKLRSAINLLKLRAYIFTCSYKTAWNQWLTDEEKQGFTFEEIKEGFK